MGAAARYTWKFKLVLLALGIASAAFETSRSTAAKARVEKMLLAAATENCNGYTTAASTQAADRPAAAARGPIARTATDADQVRGVADVGRHSNCVTSAASRTVSEELAIGQGVPTIRKVADAPLPRRPNRPTTAKPAFRSHVAWPC